MTIREIYQAGIGKLKDASVPDAKLDAWYLLEYVTGISRAMYYLRQNEEIDKAAEERYHECIARRSARIPLQHITGEQEFMGLSFHVNEHVLVPRQDTEILVEEALSHLTGGEKVLDMCTGSGCILLSLAYYRKTILGTGVDISEEALKVAQENAGQSAFDGLAVEFQKSDLFESLTGTYDMIVSNPPYIRTEVIRELEEEVRLHDPMLALDGREDGLYFYRRITEGSTKYLCDGGWLLYEIGHDQAKEVTEMMESAGFTDVSVKKDLAGLDRVVSGMYNRREK